MSNIGPNIGVTTPSYAGKSGVGGGGPAWHQIAKTSMPGTAAGTGITPAINTTGATLLVAVTSGVASPPINDSAGNTWTNAVGGVGVNTASEIWYVNNPTTSAAHTFGFSTATGYVPLLVLAYSRPGTPATPLDQTHGIAYGPLATTAQPGPITPTANNELIVASMSWSVVVTTFSASSGFVVQEFVDYTNLVSYGGGVATFVQATAAAINPTLTVGASNPSNTDGAAIASFFGA